MPVAPTRNFCIGLFTSNIEATIRNLGDMIGWESDNVTVGPITAKAKQSLLRLIPHIMPSENEQILYCLVLEHGDFGIHNMTIARDAKGQPTITSLYDWETGCIVPALVSNPLMLVSSMGICVDEKSSPSFCQEDKDATPDERT